MTNVCIVGDGLASLTLAKALVNQGIFVDFFSEQKVKKIDKSRTIGISKINTDFFIKEILNIKKLLWEINKIEIYSDNFKDQKIMNFEKKSDNLFSMLKNFELYKLLITSLKKNNLFKQRRNYKDLIFKNYDLVINCEKNNFISKKYFSRNLIKNYRSYAHTTIIDHKKYSRNNTAIQIFTNKGPLAFLPISDSKTSVVYSCRGNNNINFDNIIKKYNKDYSVLKINKISSFKLTLVNLRNYHYKNILAFGDLLHKLHPLAGQGFNMTIRDIKILLDIIKEKINLGLPLDSSVCDQFENKLRHKNYIFSNSIDLIHEFFNFERKLNNNVLSKSLKILGKNSYINKLFTKVADKGINF